MRGWYSRCVADVWFVLVPCGQGGRFGVLKPGGVKIGNGYTAPSAFGFCAGVGYAVGREWLLDCDLGLDVGRVGTELKAGPTRTGLERGVGPGQQAGRKGETECEKRELALRAVHRPELGEL